MLYPSMHVSYIFRGLPFEETDEEHGEILEFLSFHLKAGKVRDYIGLVPLFIALHSLWVSSISMPFNYGI